MTPYTPSEQHDEICEWWPEGNRPAEMLLGEPESRKGCKNLTSWSVGLGKNNWHLCDTCATLPRFKRLRRRTALPTDHHTESAT